MKKFGIALMLLGGVLSLGLAAQNAKPAPAASKLPKLDVKALPEQYRDFLNLTAYIITPAEKDIFLRLTDGPLLRRPRILFWGFPIYRRNVRERGAKAKCFPAQMKCALRSMTRQLSFTRGSK